MAPDEPRHPMTGHPRVALLATHWESSTEEGWISRQVAGALAGVADVHIVTPDGTTPSTSVDGVFTLHRLATPVDVATELRRHLLVESIAQTGDGTRPRVSPEVAALLDEGMVDPWDGADDVLSGIRPDRVVVAGHDNVGALAVLDRLDRSDGGGASGIPGVTLLALGADLQSLAFPHFDPLFARADSVLAVTETERAAVVATHGRPEHVVRIGAPMAANPSALSEPNTWVGDTDYVLVLTGVDEGDDHEENELARLVRMRFPGRPVGIAHNDAFVAWRNGQATRGWPIERSSDLDRLMAWARVTVDLRPGPFFARRCVTSLLFGTPIVVPAASRAREHAERGRGGLWASNASELVWSVEALLDPPTRASCRAQGLAYAEEEYGSTDRFIDRVTAACGLGSPDRSPVPA